MRNLIIILSLLISSVVYGQDITILQVNAKWNSHNDIEIRNIKGAKIQYAVLEDQSDNFKSSIKSVPAILIYKNQSLVWKQEAGLSFTLSISRDELIELVKNYSDNGN